MKCLLSIRKGDILTFAEQLSKSEILRICAVTEEIIIQNLQKLTIALSNDSVSEIKSSDTSLFTFPGFDTKDKEKIKKDDNENEKSALSCNHLELGNETLTESLIKHDGIGCEGTVSGLKSCSKTILPFAQKDEAVEELDRIKGTEIRAVSHNGEDSTRKKILLDSKGGCKSAMTAKDGFLALRDHVELSQLRKVLPKTIMSLELRCSNIDSKEREIRGQKSTALDEVLKGSPHEL